jgi:hypothetical protein
VPLDMRRKGELLCVTMATWPHILAKDKTNILQEGLHTSSAGGAGFPARGSQSTGSRVSHTALAKTPCVEGGTHPPSLQREDHRVRRHTVASDAWSTGSASTQGDGGVKYPCPLSLAPGTPRCSVGKCAQPTTVTLES